MGAWRFIREQFLDGGSSATRAPRRALRGPPRARARARASHKVRVAEQEAIVAEAPRPAAETPVAVRRAAPGDERSLLLLKY